MKKLFYVEPNQILRVSLETVFNKSEWEIYTLDSMDDFDFRVKDFNPAVLLLSSSLYNNNTLEKLEPFSSQIPCGFIGFKNEVNLDTSNYFYIEKPIDLSNIVTLISSYLR